MWLTPYGVKGKYSIYNKELLRVANIGATASSNVHGREYQYGAIFELIGGNVTGSSVDWAHDKVYCQIKIITFIA